MEDKKLVQNFEIVIKEILPGISAVSVEPYFNGTKVGIVFWFPKYSLAKEFISHFKSQHTFYYWFHRKEYIHSINYVSHLLSSMSHDDRVIYQAC